MQRSIILKISTKLSLATDFWTSIQERLGTYSVFNSFKARRRILGKEK